jgi:hypothetical protein
MNNDKTLQLFESMQQQMSIGPTSLDFLWIVLAIVVLLGLVHYGARWTAQRGRPHARPAIDYLVSAIDLLGLGEDDRRDLLRLAAGAKLEQPAALLLSPANLADALRRSSDPPPEPELTLRMNQLSRRLFNVNLPPMAPPKPPPGSSPKPAAAPRSHAGTPAR